jgi:hypothetical protein
MLNIDQYYAADHSQLLVEAMKFLLDEMPRSNLILSVLLEHSLNHAAIAKLETTSLGICVQTSSNYPILILTSHSCTTEQKNLVLDCLADDIVRVNIANQQYNFDIYVDQSNEDFLQRVCNAWNSLESEKRNNRILQSTLLRRERTLCLRGDASLAPSDLGDSVVKKLCHLVEGTFVPHKKQVAGKLLQAQESDLESVAALVKEFLIYTGITTHGVSSDPAGLVRASRELALKFINTKQAFLWIVSVSFM